MGVKLADYEAQFFDLMTGYLDAGSSTRARRASLAWLVLIAASLIVLGWSLARGAAKRRGTTWAWSFVTALLGPIGLLGYRLSYPQSGRPVSKWRGALEPSMFSVTGNVAGLVFVSACLAVFQPRVKADPLDPLIPFLAGWFVIRALLTTARSRRGDRIAFRQSLLAGLISMILILAGVLSVLVPLWEHWWFSLDPRSLIFWGGIAVGAMVGVVIVYPYKAWTLRSQ